MSVSPSHIASRLKFRHLRFVIALADTGSLTRTAERLSVSYPAAVKTRLEIESVIGARITSGRGDTASLTDAGRRLAETSRCIVDELDRGSEEIVALRDGLKGRLVIGVRLLDALRWLAPAIVAFRALHPDVAITLASGLHESLARNDVDMVLARMGPLACPDALAFAPLLAIRSVVVGSGRYLQARSGRGAPQWPELLAQPWCLPIAGTPLRDRFDAFLRVRGLPSPANVIDFNDLAAQAELLRAGSFLGICSEESGRELVKMGITRVLAHKLPELDDQIVLIWRAQARLRPAVLHFRDFLLAWGPRSPAAVA